MKSHVCSNVVIHILHSKNSGEKLNMLTEKECTHYEVLPYSTAQQFLLCFLSILQGNQPALYLRVYLYYMIAFFEASTIY